LLRRVVRKKKVHLFEFHTYIGTFIHTYVRAYINAEGYYLTEKYMERFFLHPLASITALDYEGVTFNWNTRVLAVCGGRQVKKIILIYNNMY
jgi:hypothetical protein